MHVHVNTGVPRSEAGKGGDERKKNGSGKGRGRLIQIE
jgi:hypothetical protein